jgi:hypothetical protein
MRPIKPVVTIRRARRLNMTKYFFFLACSVMLSCSLEVTKNEIHVEKNEFPFFAEYRTWMKINRDTIIRESEEEAREIYVNKTAVQTRGNFGTGSVLVKEQYRLSNIGGGSYVIGEIFQIAVMRKTGIGEHGGWDFRAYDPKTGSEIPGLSEGCALCHAKRKSFDFIFSNF